MATVTLWSCMETEKKKRERKGEKAQGAHCMDNTVSSDHVNLALWFSQSRLSRETEEQIKLFCSFKGEVFAPFD